MEKLILKFFEWVAKTFGPEAVPDDFNYLSLNLVVGVLLGIPVFIGMCGRASWQHPIELATNIVGYGIAIYYLIRHLPKVAGGMRKTIWSNAIFGVLACALGIFLSIFVIAIMLICGLIGPVLNFAVDSLRPEEWQDNYDGTKTNKRTGERYKVDEEGRITMKVN